MGISLSGRRPARSTQSRIGSRCSHVVFELTCNSHCESTSDTQMMNQSIVSTSLAPCGSRHLPARTMPFRTRTGPQQRNPLGRSRGQLRVSAAAYICKDCGYVQRHCQCLMLPPHACPPSRTSAKEARIDSAGRWIYEEKGSATFKDLPSSFKCPVRSGCVSSYPLEHFAEGAHSPISHKESFERLQVCAAPKRRFGSYSGKGGNTKAAMDERYAKLQSGTLSAGGGG